MSSGISPELERQHAKAVATQRRLLRKSRADALAAGAPTSLCVMDTRHRMLLCAYGYIPPGLVRPRYGAGAAATTVGLAEQLTFRRAEWDSLVRTMRAEAALRTELADEVERMLAAEDLADAGSRRWARANRHRFSKQEASDV